MKTLIVGLGNQGLKRKKYINKDFIGSVDPLNKKADFKNIKNVDLSIYNSVLLCVPDSEKLELIKYCLKNRKHVLVEKPLHMKSSNLKEIYKISKKNNTILYTAYNHRFEPHFKNAKNFLDNNSLGKFHFLKMFYGNGTSQLVKKSNWKDRKMGVISDLGSHLLDSIDFFLNIRPNNFNLVSKNYLENKSPDHAVFLHKTKSTLIHLEVSLCMWRNTFRCDLVFEKGSLHIDSLCKWGPSRLTIRKRIFPSGKPYEKNKVILSDDPTWNKEYKYFKSLIYKNQILDVSKDLWINEVLESFGKKN